MNGNRNPPRDRRGRFCKAGEAQAEAAGAGKAASGWSKEKEAAFFRKLGIASDLGLALEAAGLPADGAEVQRRLETDPGFRAKWSAALDAGYALLELEMQGRARSPGRRRAARTPLERKLREVPSSTALQLLKLHQARLKAGARGAAELPPLANARELRKRLDAKLSDFNRQMGGEG